MSVFFSSIRLADYSREAFLALSSNKLRSFLSILGVLIGVAAVIVMLAIGNGAQKQVSDSLSSMGSNLFMVTTSFRSRGISLGAETVTRFTSQDLEALKKIEGVSRVVPYVTGRGQSVYQNRNWNTTILGSGPDYQYARNSLPEIGRFFNETEISDRAKVAVLGKNVADELFADENPVGRQIRINRINFNVIGVMPEKGASGFRNVDDQILIPYTTAMHRVMGRDYINNFDVQAKDTDSMIFIQTEIQNVLSKLHKLNESQMENIDVRNMADIQKATTDIIKTLAILLGSIAAVSLFVGGIGIMNIMLVIVMERTHEIGLRKALGAENRDIMLQFLVEAVLICVLGGLLGIMFGWIVSWLISSVAGWYTLISIQSVVLAFTFSVIVGVIFGIWPAMRAAKLLPIEALRHE